MGNREEQREEVYGEQREELYGELMSLQLNIGG